jgi:hypothetical protein
MANKCDHVSCEHCLSQLLMLAIKDDKLWPMQCCKDDIDVINSAKSVLKKEDFIELMKKSLQVNCTNFMYC